MTSPEDALALARERAAAAPWADDPEGFRIAPTERVGIDRLMEWAVIEPDETLMRSTRVYGKPITWLKRLLLRGLQQHFNELTAQETRFHLHAVVRLAELEDRIVRLEAELAEARRP